VNPNKATHGLIHTILLDVRIS